MLPQKVQNDYVRDLRKQDIARRKVLFAWSPRPTKIELGWGMNRLLSAATYDDLPKFLKRDEVRYSDLQRTRFTALLNSYAQRISGRWQLAEREFRMYITRSKTICIQDTYGRCIQYI